MCDKCGTIRVENPDFTYCPYCGEEFGINKVYDAIDTIQRYCANHECHNCKFYNAMVEECILTGDCVSIPTEWPEF